MARRCSICSRSDSSEIDANLAEGRSARSIAHDLGLSEDALQRHARHRHRPTAETVPNATADPLAELVDALRARALTGDPQVAHQYRLSLLALDARQAAPVTRRLEDEPEFIALRYELVRILDRFPDARRAVIEAWSER